MKISYLWLKDWINSDLSAQQIANHLTSVGLEVDAITPVSGDFTQVFVAEIVAIKPHPQADRLSICRVDINDGGLRDIVCGAANVRVGLKTALAIINATLPGNIKIKKSKLRGELSEGMLCGSAELGINDDANGIIELNDSATVGLALDKYLQLDDEILSIDLTPNRADCFSIKGIAKELNCLTKSAKLVSKSQLQKVSFESQIVLKVLAPKACPSYFGRILSGIDNKIATPDWMKERLRRSGLRSKSLIADVTNYVMLELGQPLHSFAKQGNYIEVRYAKKSEQLQLLDGQNIELSADDLVIADASGVLALAGIMGGEFSAVDEASTTIFLESAFFKPEVLSGVARKHNLCTDASQRYERGVDPFLQQTALDRATQLLVEIAHAKVGSLVSNVAAEYLPTNPLIKFDISLIKKLTGLDLAIERVASILSDSGMQVTKVAAKRLDVIANSSRFDIKLAQDLVEEVLRIEGFAKLQASKAATNLGEINLFDTCAFKLGKWFSARGYQEIISYSFVDPKLQDAIYNNVTSLRLLNPISPELSVMRQGLWPGLIAAMVHNLYRQNSQLKFFEIGTVFEPDETTMLGGLLTGKYGVANCNENEHEYNFFDAKGDLEALFATLGITNYAFVAQKHNSLHPGQSAAIMIDDDTCGFIGTLHPKLAFGTQNVILFEMKLKPLTTSRVASYQAVSKFPITTRDLALITDKNITAAAIKDTIFASDHQNWLKEIKVFDVYEGTNIPKGKKSIAINLLLQKIDKTFIDKEISDFITAILKVLADKFDIYLRE